MNNDPVFKLRSAEGVPTVTIQFEGRAMTAPVGVTVAAALLAANVRGFRTTPVTGAPRAPFCMMGVCFDCMVEIDGVPSRQSCLVLVREGISVRMQRGARALDSTADDEGEAA